MRDFLIFVIINIFGILFSNAQDKFFSYLPSSQDSVFQYIKKVNETKKVKLATVYPKEIKKIIDERNESFIKTIKDSSYIFDKRISKYLSNIVNEIYKTNPTLNKKDHYFFVNKSPIPNAACYGNGIFTINLGLLTLMQSDDELAFVLSHEIAHFVLEHNDQSLLSYVKKYNSKEIKEKIRAVNRKQYGKRQAISDFVKDLNYNFLRRSRKLEMQADSLGFVIFSKTKYKKSASQDALKRLEFVDEMVFNENSNIRTHFNFDEYQFKEGWVAREETLFDLKVSANDFEFDKDSLKTHPDISFRVTELKKMIVLNDSNSKNFEDIQKIKKIVADDCIAIFMDDSRIDLALYQTLIMQNQNQLDEKTYCITIGQILKRTYELKNNHTFGKYVSPINTFSNEKYLNEIKLFLENIQLKSLKKIGFHFCQKYKNLMNGNLEFNKISEFFSIQNK